MQTNCIIFLKIIHGDFIIMQQSNFYSMLFRMKYINRWGLMNNTRYENLSEHSLEVAMIAHCLVMIANKRFGKKLDGERAAILALFHDSTEIITGDMPTPIKYFNPTIINVYKEIETAAADKLIALLPEDFKEDMEHIIKMNTATDIELKPYIKAADKFSALIKCINEIRMGNDEFIKAKETILTAIRDMNMPESKVFEDEFLPPFMLSLDEQG